MTEKSRIFRSLHQGPGLLLLPNAWDAVTARLTESLGAEAIATTSAGLAWSHGHADGNALPEDRLLAAIGDMVRVIRVPLTVDVEAGYSDDPRAVARLVARVAAVGAVGINIEDGAGSPDLLCHKITSIRETTAALGVDLFINTRTDVYLRGSRRGPRPSRKPSTEPRAIAPPAVTDSSFQALPPSTPSRPSRRPSGPCPSTSWPFPICRP